MCSLSHRRLLWSFPILNPATGCKPAFMRAALYPNRMNIDPTTLLWLKWQKKRLFTTQNDL
jgi:hypothetical protein